jgi:rhodanese-related sulfurtransferase
MELISMLELKERVETLKPGEVVLDVRTEDEYRDGHVRGSIHIPYDEGTESANSKSTPRFTFIVARVAEQELLLKRWLSWV